MNNDSLATTLLTITNSELVYIFATTTHTAESRAVKILLPLPAKHKVIFFFRK